MGLATKTQDPIDPRGDEEQACKPSILTDTQCEPPCCEDDLKPTALALNHGPPEDALAILSLLAIPLIPQQLPLYNVLALCLE